MRALLIVILALALASCGTQRVVEVPVTQVTRDTVWQHRVDTVTRVETVTVEVAVASAVKAMFEGK